MHCEIDVCGGAYAVVDPGFAGHVTRVGHGVCVIEDALIMGSDYYETMEECELLPGCMPIGLGNGTVVKKCIIDKNARIGHNCQIINKDNVQEAMCEEEGYIIKDGIVVIIKDSIIPDGTVI